MKNWQKKFRKNYRREEIDEEKYSIKSRKLHDENHGEQILRDLLDDE